MDTWCDLEHDIVASSGGNWAARMWADSATLDHLVTAEVQEGLTAYEWRGDPDHPYPATGCRAWSCCSVSVRKDVSTSAGFDWALLHQLFAAHVIDETGHPRDDRAWHTTAARPSDPSDRQNWQTVVQAGASRWLGKGWGMKVARSTQSSLFGARFGISTSSSLGENDIKLQRLQPLISAAARRPSPGTTPH